MDREGIIIIKKKKTFISWKKCFRLIYPQNQKEKKYFNIYILFYSLFNDLCYYYLYFIINILYYNNLVSSLVFMTILMQFRSLTFVFYEDNKACLNTIVIIIIVVVIVIILLFIYF